MFGTEIFGFLGLKCHGFWDWNIWDIEMSAIEMSGDDERTHNQGSAQVFTSLKAQNIHRELFVFEKVWLFRQKLCYN